MKKINLKKPYKVNIDISTLCNHSCTFCSNPDKRTIKEITKFGNFKTILSNITQYVSIKELALSAKGEVLLNHDLEKIIKYTKEKYEIPYIYISTNGSLLDKKRIEKLMNSGINSIKLSINATNKEDYKNIHLKDHFDTVITNLKNLLLYKKNHKLKVKILISQVTDKKTEDVKNDFKILLNDLYTYLDDIFIYEKQYRPHEGFEKKNIKPNAKYCLISPFNELYINSNGHLNFCCLDYFGEMDFGSLITNDFLDLFSSKSYQDTLKRFKTNNFEKNSLCYNCLISEGSKK